MDLEQAEARKSGGGNVNPRETYSKMTDDELATSQRERFSTPFGSGSIDD
jgi:hypothetical protein